VKKRCLSFAITCCILGSSVPCSLCSRCCSSNRLAIIGNESGHEKKLLSGSARLSTLGRRHEYLSDFRLPQSSRLISLQGQSSARLFTRGQWEKSPEKSILIYVNLVLLCSISFSVFGPLSAEAINHNLSVLCTTRSNLRS
jgi:hypothetical protein